MNVLVTGGAGFIGSHLVERLLIDGHLVICIDNFDNFYDPGIKRRNLQAARTNGRFHLIEGDIRDVKILEEVFSRFDIEIVVHLAARAGVRPSLLEPELYYEVNVVGTLCLLEVMRLHHVPKMIFASSSSVYGNDRTLPFSEGNPADHPISPYAASKKAAELLCHTYHHLYGFDIFCLRLFTVYGPRQRPEMGISQFITQILDGTPIVLYGDGSSERDYTYIDDIVDGFMGSLQCLRGFDVINLGESRPVPLIYLIKTIERLIGNKAIIQSRPMQPGDVTITYADISKAHELLGYRPCHPIEGGLAKQIEWIRKMKGTW
jgi:UDP-glucuronate 4-epimerase